MCQFIQAFAAMSHLSKVNLQKKADKQQALSEWKSMETVGGTSR
jgi:hypothetical protein